VERIWEAHVSASEAGGMAARDFRVGRRRIEQTGGGEGRRRLTEGKAGKMKSVALEPPFSLFGGRPIKI
jgi:hypothetical protein